jgi:hypothetical protein
MDQTLPINLLNINTNTNEECIICKEELQCHPCYTLPECKHTYHTSCLVSWFRNGDNRCPCCGNKGINNKCNEDNNYLWRKYRQNYLCIQGFENQYISDLKKFMNDKNNINNPFAIKLKKNFDKIKILENTLRKNNSSYKTYKEKIKKEPILYSEYKKTVTQFKNNKYKLSTQIKVERFKLINNNYIIPLIVPMPVNIH